MKCALRSKNYVSWCVPAAMALLAVLPACNRDNANAASASGSPSAKAKPTATTVDSANAFDVTGLDMLLKENRGKTVVVNFWATWCPPCVQEMPEFAEFYREHNKAGDAVTFISMSADNPETIDSAIKPFVAKHKIPFPIHVMSFMPSDELTGVLGYEWVDGNLPATFVYKPDGKLQNVWFVQITKADLDKAVAKAAGK